MLLSSNWLVIKVLNNYLLCLFFVYTTLIAIYRLSSRRLIRQVDTLTCQILGDESAQFEQALTTLRDSLELAHTNKPVLRYFQVSGLTDTFRASHTAPSERLKYVTALGQGRIVIEKQAQIIELRMQTEILAQSARSSDHPLGSLPRDIHCRIAGFLAGQELTSDEAKIVVNTKFAAIQRREEAKAPRENLLRRLVFSLRNRFR